MEIAQLPSVDPQDEVEAQDGERDPTNSKQLAGDETKDKGEDDISSSRQNGYITPALSGVPIAYHRKKLTCGPNLGKMAP